jgi:Protein of unknown function (DUF1573)
MKSTTGVTLRLMTWVMALCPLSMAVLFHTEIHSIPLSIKNPPRPALAFNQYAVDLRKISASSEANAIFVFQNRGTESVRITSLEPSCGCLTPLLQGDHNKVIPAGEFARVIIRMQPANSTPGPHEYTVRVKYSDPNPQETQLTLKLEIPKSTLFVSPPALIVYHPKDAEPTTYDFMITDGRGTRFEITEVSINSDLVETAIGETSRTQTGLFQQSVRVSIAGELPPTRTQALLRIKTNDPEVPELRVPLMMQGPVGAVSAEGDHALDHEHHKH